MKLIQNVKVACAKQGVTIAECERALGWCPNSIHAWRFHSPAVDKVVDLADYLHCSVDELARETNSL